MREIQLKIKQRESAVYIICWLELNPAVKQSFAAIYFRASIWTAYWHIDYRVRDQGLQMNSQDKTGAWVNQENNRQC